MINDNENKKLSRNRKRRIERKIKMNIDTKLLLNKIKSEKRKRNKYLHKIKQLKILLVNIKYANDANKLQSALKELNKIQVVNKNLHEIKHEILIDYEGVFEMVGFLKVGDQIRQTHIRFRNIAMKLILTALTKVTMLMILFSMVIFIKSTLLNLT